MILPSDMVKSVIRQSIHNVGLNHVGGKKFGKHPSPLLKRDVFPLHCMCDLALGAKGWVPAVKKGPLPRNQGQGLLERGDCHFLMVKSSALLGSTSYSSPAHPQNLFPKISLSKKAIQKFYIYVLNFFIFSMYNF